MGNRFDKEGKWIRVWQEEGVCLLEEGSICFVGEEAGFRVHLFSLVPFPKDDKAG
jgi:hypothetical protein